MNHKNFKDDQRKSTDNRPKKVPPRRPKNISPPNVKKVEKKPEKKEAGPKAAAPKATEPKVKKDPHIAVNRDVLRESREIAQGSLKPTEDKSVPEEMAAAAAPSAEVSKETPAAETPKPMPEETERPVVAAPAEKKAEQPTAAVSAEKKVVVAERDITALYNLFEDLSLEDKQVEETAGATVTSFRLNLSDGTDYELVYVCNGVKSGKLKSSTGNFEYFTSSDIGSYWSNMDLEAVPAEESELPK